MATFTGNGGDNVANANNGNLKGFTGGSSFLLKDASGDRFLCGDGNDTVIAGSGNDLIQGGLNGDRLIGGLGNDTIYAMTKADPSGSASPDYIEGGSGNNSIIGGNGRDTIFGGAGNDTIASNLGANSMNGGTGIDTLNLSNITQNYSLNMTTGVTNFGGQTGGELRESSIWAAGGSRHWQFRSQQACRGHRQ